MGLSFSCMRGGPAVEGDPKGLWLDAPHLKLGKGTDVRSKYKFTRSALGEGSTSTVWLAVDRSSKDPFAIKQCSKELLKGTDTSSSRVSEVEILVKVQEEGHECPGVPRLLATYEDPLHLYLVFPFLSGGDLFDHVSTHSKLSEQSASRLMKRLLNTVSHLHQQGIAHLDINPTNILFSSTVSCDPHLSDFGSATELSPSQHINAPPPPAGSVRLFFSAPEATKGVWEQPSDMWSMGAVLFVLLGGIHPTHVLSTEITANPAWLKLQMGQVDGLPDNTSAAVHDLLQKLLCADMGSRPSAEEALHHPWIACPEFLHTTPLEATISNCKEFTAARGSPGSEQKFYVQEGRITIPKVLIQRAKADEGELKWTKVGVVTSCLREFDRADSAKKVCVEVLERRSPRRRSRQHSKEYFDFTPRESRPSSRGPSRPTSRPPSRSSSRPRTRPATASPRGRGGGGGTSIPRTSSAPWVAGKGAGSDSEGGALSETDALRRPSRRRSRPSTASDKHRARDTGAMERPT